MDQRYSGIFVIALYLVNSLAACSFVIGNTDCVPPDSLALELLGDPAEKGIQAFIDLSSRLGSSSSSIGPDMRDCHEIPRRLNHRLPI